MSIAVIGDSMLDVLVDGEVTRSSPEAPWAPLLLQSSQTYRLGGAGILANNVRTLGEDVCLITALGNDPASMIVADLCDEAGIKLVATECDRTTTKTYIGAYHLGYRTPLFRTDIDATWVKPFWNKDDIVNILYNSDCVLLADYCKGFVHSFQNIFIEFNGGNLEDVPLLIDPKPKNLRFYPYCYCSTPNKSEVLEAGCDPSDLDGRNLGHIANVFYCHNLVLTRDCEGVILYTDNSETYLFNHAPDNCDRIATVIGAGKSFIAALSVLMVRGLNIIEATEIAEKVSKNYVMTGQIELPSIEK